MRKTRNEQMSTGLPPTADMKESFRHSHLCRDICGAAKKILFDHFVGPYQERFRDLKAKRLRSFEIDHQLELG